MGQTRQSTHRDPGIKGLLWLHPNCAGQMATAPSPHGPRPQGALASFPLPAQIAIQVSPHTGPPPPPPPPHPPSPSSSGLKGLWLHPHFQHKIAAQVRPHTGAHPHPHPLPPPASEDFGMRQTGQQSGPRLSPEGPRCLSGKAPASLAERKGSLPSCTQCSRTSDSTVQVFPVQSYQRLNSTSFPSAVVPATQQYKFSQCSRTSDSTVQVFPVQSYQRLNSTSFPSAVVPATQQYKFSQCSRTSD